jgi:transposase, IS5 family
MKSDGLLGRCHLKGTEGDAMHAVLCGVSHNLRLLLHRLRAFLRLIYDWIASGLLFSFGMPAQA